MKKIILLAVCLMSASYISSAQAGKDNSIPNSIIGEYLVPDAKNGDSKVRFTKNDDGTFDCQVFWLQIPVDPSTGKPWLDTKNPDKSLRSRRADQIVLVKGLKYNAELKQWDGAKIYDPNRGIRANVTCKFSPSGKLQVRGTVLGIGETQNWEKL